jgi:hypothetical protein
MSEKGPFEAMGAGIAGPWKVLQWLHAGEGDEFVAGALNAAYLAGLREGEERVKELEDAASGAKSMLHTVADCSSHECQDCREWAGKHRDILAAALAKLRP